MMCVFLQNEIIWKYYPPKKTLNKKTKKNKKIEKIEWKENLLQWSWLLISLVLNFDLHKTGGEEVPN
jgi:hypothetical protein